MSQKTHWQATNPLFLWLTPSKACQKALVKSLFACKRNLLCYACTDVSLRFSNKPARTVWFVSLLSCSSKHTNMGGVPRAGSLLYLREQWAEASPPGSTPRYGKPLSSPFSFYSEELIARAQLPSGPRQWAPRGNIQILAGRLGNQISLPFPQTRSFHKL